MSTRGSLVYWCCGRNHIHLYDETSELNRKLGYSPHIEITIGWDNKDGSYKWYKNIYDGHVPEWFAKLLMKINKIFNLRLF